MGFVKYIYNEQGEKVFDISENLLREWNFEYGKSMSGLVLVDRNNENYTVEISKTDWFCGIFRVFFKDGGWQCLDHCIEQFKTKK